MEPLKRELAKANSPNKLCFPPHLLHLRHVVPPDVVGRRVPARLLLRVRLREDGVRDLLQRLALRLALVLVDAGRVLVEPARGRLERRV